MTKTSNKKVMGRNKKQINSRKTIIFKKEKCKKTGRWMLVEDGYKDDWEEMQLKAKGTELSNYVSIDENNEMIAKTSISEISNSTEPAYMDISHISKNKIENFNAVKRGKALKKEADAKAAEFAKWQEREAKKANDLEKAKKLVEKETTTKVEKTGGKE